jgi:hypothetical protein
MEGEPGPYTKKNKPVNIVYCHKCAAVDGRAQFVAIAWPNGRLREAWLHKSCEQAFLEKIENKDNQ